MVSSPWRDLLFAYPFNVLNADWDLTTAEYPCAVTMIVYLP